MSDATRHRPRGPAPAAGHGEPVRARAGLPGPGPRRPPGRTARGGLRPGRPGRGGRPGRAAAGLRRLRLGRAHRHHTARRPHRAGRPGLRASWRGPPWPPPRISATTADTSRGPRLRPRPAGAAVDRAGRARSWRAGTRPTSGAWSGATCCCRGRPGRRRGHLFLAGALLARIAERLRRTTAGTRPRPGPARPGRTGRPGSAPAGGPSAPSRSANGRAPQAGEPPGPRLAVVMARDLDAGGGGPAPGRCPAGPAARGPAGRRRAGHRGRRGRGSRNRTRAARPPRPASATAASATTAARRPRGRDRQAAGAAVLRGRRSAACGARCRGIARAPATSCTPPACSRAMTNRPGSGSGPRPCCSRSWPAGRCRACPPRCCRAGGRSARAAASASWPRSWTAR